MQYRSYRTLAHDVAAWSDTLPWDLDLIVGVPRSGLLVGNLLALHRNLPLADLDGFLAGRFLRGGRRSPVVPETFLGTRRRVLVVDDIVGSGTAIRAVRERVEAVSPAHDVLYGAPYLEPGREALVDFHHEHLAPPRIFQWNVFHSPRWLPRFCVDLDGVLCRDPVEEEDDDGARYADFIENVPARLVPTAKIGCIVTARLEKYRAQTEAWLARHGVQYDDLLMLDLPDAATRKRLQPHAAFKADAYKRTEAALFIESSTRQSKEIARLTGWPVLCVRTGELVHPAPAVRQTRRAQRLLGRALRRVTKPWRG